MKKVSLLAQASVAGVITATVIAAPAFACHPVGGIVKDVQDQTTGSATVGNNNTAKPLTVNTGDTLVYTVTVTNSGAAASNGDDDMTNVVLTDTLPAGLEMADGSSPTISAQLGTIKPGASMQKSYTVKVTDTTNGDIITNKACYTGDSIDNKDNQTGCNSAVVKVNVPTTTTPTPSQPTTPTTPTTPAATTLPNTGSTALSAISVVSVTAVLGYAANLLRMKLRSNA